MKTPTLIVTDPGDQRVPKPTSSEFFHALRAAGALAELLISGRRPFPDRPAECLTHSQLVGG